MSLRSKSAQQLYSFKLVTPIRSDKFDKALDKMECVQSAFGEEASNRLPDSTHGQRALAGVINYTQECGQ